MTNDNTRPDNTPHTHHTRVYSVHSKVKTMPISMVPECPHFQGLNGCSTRIKSILPSLFQSTIRGRRKSVRFAVTRSKGLSSTSRNWPSESWRKWIMGCAKSAIRRSNRPSWSQSATLKCPQPRTPLMRRKGFSFKALSLQWTSTPNKRPKVTSSNIRHLPTSVLPSFFLKSNVVLIVPHTRFICQKHIQFAIAVDVKNFGQTRKKNPFMSLKGLGSFFTK